jgi:hypothetical protein
LHELRGGIRYLTFDARLSANDALRRIRDLLRAHDGAER